MPDPARCTICGDRVSYEALRSDRDEGLPPSASPGQRVVACSNCGQLLHVA
jgi:hypothetical protein